MTRSAYPVMIVVTLGLLLYACDDRVEVPTAAVVERPLVHKVSAEGMLRAASSTPIAVPTDLPSSARLAWIAKDGSRVKAGDLVARFDRMSIEEMLDEGQDAASVARKRMAKIDIETEKDIGKLGKDLAVAEEQLKHAREFLKIDQGVFSRRDIVEDAIDEDLAVERKDHAEHATDLRRQVAVKERQLLEIEERQAQLKIDRANRALTGLDARAPHDGIVTLVRDWRGTVPTVGREMWPGQPVAEIPDLTAMEAEIFVLEADAGGVAQGLEADVVVEAHPEVTHRASVTRMEALAKPKISGSPVQYFGVSLSFTDLSGDALASMKPGQRVRATLYLASLDQALVVPRQAVSQQGDESSVWLRSGSRFVQQVVELGTLTPGLAAIVSGVAEGDVVALAEPPLELRVEGGDSPAPDAEPEAAAESTAEIAGESP